MRRLQKSIQHKLYLLFILLTMNTYSQNTRIAKPRMYYHEEKLYGESLKSSLINLSDFDFLLSSKPFGSYQTTETTQVIRTPQGLESVPVNLFRYCTLQKDGLTYDSEKGSFYLPEAIFMFDVNDSFPFPSDFYFVAKIGDQLELCRCKGNMGRNWYELADQCQPVEDAMTLEKAENTFEYLKDYIEFELKEDERIELEKEEKIAQRLLLNPEKKAAYLELTSLCMPHSAKKEEVVSFINGLKEYNDEDSDDFHTTYDEFRMYLNRNGIPFIITIDWSESVEEMENWVSAAVKENFGQTFRFNYEDIYNSNSSVSDVGLLTTFDYQLQTLGLRITRIESDSDAYELIIHPVNTLDVVIRTLSVMDLSLDSLF